MADKEEKIFNIDPLWKLIEWNGGTKKSFVDDLARHHIKVSRPTLDRWLSDKCTIDCTTLALMVNEYHLPTPFITNRKLFKNFGRYSIIDEGWIPVTITPRSIIVQRFIDNNGNKKLTASELGMDIEQMMEIIGERRPDGTIMARKAVAWLRDFGYEDSQCFHDENIIIKSEEEARLLEVDKCYRAFVAENLPFEINDVKLQQEIQKYHIVQKYSKPDK